MGFSRDTFYRIKKAYGEGGIEALYEKSRRKPNFKNRVSEEVERAVVELALEDPSLGQKRVSDELRKRGIFVSPAGVRSIWLRHGLERFEKRLRALEERVAQTGEILTERQLRALEKAQEEKIAQGGNRDRARGISGGARYLLCGHYQRDRPDLPVDFYRHLFKSGFCEALHQQASYQQRKFTERSGDTVF